MIVEGVCNIPSMYATKITGPEERGEEKEESSNCSKEAQKWEIWKVRGPWQTIASLHPEASKP